MSDLPTPTTKAPWLGMSIGVNDRTGKPIHIGDLLHFDPAEWGSESMYFCVEFRQGEALPGCCRVDRRALRQALQP